MLAAAVGGWAGQYLDGVSSSPRAEQASDDAPNGEPNWPRWGTSDSSSADRLHLEVAGARVGDPVVSEAEDLADHETKQEDLQPERVRIDQIQVDTPVIPVGLLEDRSLYVPEDAHNAGWWSGGSLPGEPGPAVIVAHVDSKEGPGAFYELIDLSPGDEVQVDRADGTTTRWLVQTVESYPKEDFPTEAVYGRTPEPTLRLITCGGAWDRQESHYEDNIIAFLELVDETPAQ